MKRATFTVCVAGKAGEGVKKAAQVIAQILASRGKEVIQYDDYQSLIKGGHNFSVVSASDREIHAAYSTFDLLICFDKQSLTEHRNSLNPGASVFYNSDEGESDYGTPLPMTSLMKRIYEPPGNVSLAAVGAFSAYCGLDKDSLNKMISAQYKQNTSTNIAYANAIYDIIDSRYDVWGTAQPSADFRYLSGNQMIALGAWIGGLDFYFGYPMTPASSLLHYLALKQESWKVQTVHAESELAAINMAVGAAIAGCRAAVGSSGGGFALMQEALSLAGMAEIPLLCVLSSRPGPSTGVSTYTAQEDLFFALYQGHGEFPRVVASPDSFDRACSLSAELMHLSWQYQTPTILLTEKHLSEGMMKLQPDVSALPDTDILPDAPDSQYQRYAISESGISPLAFPYQGENAVIKWSSHEHLPSGLRTDKATDMVAMKDKRTRKTQALNEACKAFQRVAEYGEGEQLVFAYGSTVMELREAAKHCATPFRIIAPIYLHPFPLEELEAYKGQTAVVVEHSVAHGFAQYLMWQLGLNVSSRINKYDGRPFDPLELAKRLEEAFHA